MFYLKITLLDFSFLFIDLLSSFQRYIRNLSDSANNINLTSKKNIDADKMQPRFYLHLYYNFSIKLYQILDFYTCLMLRRHFMCSINFVAARLNGCCFFHASTLFEVSLGDTGRKIIFSLSKNGTEPSITREYAKPL